MARISILVVSCCLVLAAVVDLTTDISSAQRVPVVRYGPVPVESGFPWAVAVLLLVPAIVSPLAASLRRGRALEVSLRMIAIVALPVAIFRDIVVRNVLADSGAWGQTIVVLLILTGWMLLTLHRLVLFSTEVNGVRASFVAGLSLGAICLVGWPLYVSRGWEFLLYLVVLPVVSEAVNVILSPRRSREEASPGAQVS